MRWNHISRRRLMQGLTVAAAVSELEASDTMLPTEELGPGPFYKAGAPERNTLREKGMEGQPLRVGGKVLDTRGRPLKNGRVEIWHVNAKGEYDNEGFRLRGQTRCSPAGEYWFETIQPVAYGSRCAHLHVRVTGDGARPIATEIQFEGDPVRVKDRGSRQSLAMKTEMRSGELHGTFVFVLRDA